MQYGATLLRPVTRPEAELLVGKGFDHVAIDFPWYSVLRDRDTEDWLLADHIQAPLDAAGLETVLRVGLGHRHLLPPWLDEAGGAAHRDYPSEVRKAVRAAALHYTRVRRFQFEGPLNLASSWDLRMTRRRAGARWRDRAFAMDLLRDALQTLRELRPDADRLLAISTAQPGWARWLERTLADLPTAPTHVSLEAFPCYLLPDPDLASRLEAVVEQAREVTDLPVELGAVGYPTHRRPWSQRRQRVFLVDAVARARAAGVERLCFHSFRDQSYPDPLFGYWLPRQERFLGLVRYDGTPKSCLEELRVAIQGTR